MHQPTECGLNETLNNLPHVPHASPGPDVTRRTPGWVVCSLVNERLVWIDCEMTGLDYVADALIEIAAVVTDYDLNVLGDGVDLVIKPPAEALDQMDDFVRSMHEKSGLLEELDSGLTPRGRRAAGARLRA